MSDTNAQIILPQTPAALRPNGVSSRRFGSLRAIAALIIREMSTQYGRTPGGFIWTVLQPLGAVGVLAIGFSVLLHRPSLGTSFILFYASAYVFFIMYATLERTVSDALHFSAPLLRFPSVTWVDAFVARVTLNALMGTATGVLLIGGLFLVVGRPGPLDFAALMQATALTVLLGFGVGAFNCALKGIVPLYAIIWDVVTRPLMIASGILFNFEDVPQVAQDLLWFNPIIHITALGREGIYSIYEPQFVSIPYVLTVSMIPLFFGLLLTRRYHRDILNW